MTTSSINSFTQTICAEALRVFASSLTGSEQRAVLHDAERADRALAAMKRVLSPRLASLLTRTPEEVAATPEPWIRDEVSAIVTLAVSEGLEAFRSRA